jgi:hypothetical protein
VLGATNRYLFADPFPIDQDYVRRCSETLEDIYADEEEVDPENMENLMWNLRDRFSSTDWVTIPPSNDTLHINTVSLDNTVIELYNYIRVVERVNEGELSFPIQRGYTARACRPAQSLDKIQKKLDQDLPARWQGKVVFKNREDAPACTACGFDLMKEWEHKIKSDDSTDPIGPESPQCDNDGSNQDGDDNSGEQGSSTGLTSRRLSLD